MRALDATGRALAGEGGAADAIRRNVAYLKSEPAAVFGVTHACAALGDLSTSFAILQGYYFGEGPWNKVAPAAGDEDRATSPLFQPPMHNAWRDSRFGALLQRIGLDDYWRASRTVPDFRRSS